LTVPLSTVPLSTVLFSTVLFLTVVFSIVLFTVGDGRDSELSMYRKIQIPRCGPPNIWPESVTTNSCCGCRNSK
jgi:hypothetical protein